MVVRWSGLELPPRTRRIPLSKNSSKLYSGTTSAHAENTSHTLKIRSRDWNYLRARGEYEITASKPTKYEELPPRTRRILVRRKYFDQELGTTSAHAENTLNELGLL